MALTAGRIRVFTVRHQEGGVKARRSGPTGSEARNKGEGGLDSGPTRGTGFATKRGQRGT